MSIDLVAAFRFLCLYPAFLKQKSLFLKMGGVAWNVRNYPVLLDRAVQSATLGEYFWQDLYIAKRIIEANPVRHIDVGSRVDGFIAHLACVRAVEIFDIRPLSARIENVSFQQWDITDSKQEFGEIADCLSCLHTLEHIGLGRYGDPLDPDGW